MKEDLIPLNKRTPEEVREITSKAGKASGASRRRKKLLRELLEIALSQKTETGDYYTDITTALVKKAADGSEKAYQLIRDTLGQAPEQVINLESTSIKINIDGEDKNE